MQLSILAFQGWVERQVASAQSSCKTLLDLTVGSVLRAILEANAAVALWMQWLILLVLQTTRAATSTGPDLDTWVADFGLTRLPAVPASVAVTFSRLTTGQPALIVPGTTVKTVDGTQVFIVVEDDSNASWSVSAGASPGYFVPAAAASATVPCQAVTPGSAGNVQPGTIALLASGVSGIDGVSNALAATGGIDAETDPNLRTRFANYIQSRSRATAAAIGYAITSLQQGLSYQLAENFPRPGMFTAYVDDGSGHPPAALLTAVYAAIDLVRPVGTTFTVQPPSVLGAAISVIVTPAPGVTQAYADAAVGTALAAYVASLGMGQPLSYLALARIALDSDPGVSDVTALLLNGGTASLPGAIGQVIRLASLSAG